MQAGKLRLYIDYKSPYAYLAVAPAYRRQGIAALLLARVCRDAAAEGFAAVEGYPNARFESTESDFMGPAALFARQGFAEAGRAGGRLVMRKPL